MVATKPIPNFSFESLSFFYLTPEKKIATISTDNKLQDLAKTIAENDAPITAILYVATAAIIITPHLAPFRNGIRTVFYFRIYC